MAKALVLGFALRHFNTQFFVLFVFYCAKWRYIRF